MLSDITIIIPTFHRRGYLADCLQGISNNLPECEVVVVSDDGVIPQTENEIYLPYDSGLTAKRNAGVTNASTSYCLIGSDDFDFSRKEVRQGLIEMEIALDCYPHIDVVAGRVNNRPYEGYFSAVEGEYIKEWRLEVKNTWPFSGHRTRNVDIHHMWQVDIAVNYFLARTKVLREVPWDEKIFPIGGEHADWFLDMKAANKTVVVMPYANITTQPYDASKQHPLYKQYRNRAFSTGHQLMMEKRGIKKYYGFDEEV
jgi:glycosyltransferase involved in cell wall biosynthesis